MEWIHALYKNIRFLLCQCLSGETLKAVGPFFLVYAGGSKISHPVNNTQKYECRRYWKRKNLDAYF